MNSLKVGETRVGTRKTKDFIYKDLETKAHFYLFLMYHSSHIYISLIVIVYEENVRREEKQ